MYKSLSVLLVAFALSTPAHADVFGFLTSNGGPAPVAEGHVYAPSQTTIVGGGVTPGYPFYSGCCESKPACSTGWWDGFCGGGGCSMSCCRPWGLGHGCSKGGCGVSQKGGCGPSQKGGCRISFGKGGCATGGCGISFGKGGCGPSQKGGCGFGFGKGGCSTGGCAIRGYGKGGCEIGSACGSKTYYSPAPCGPQPCRLGLFDWMHFGHGSGKGKGKGCSACGDMGCSSCGGGITTYGDSIQPAPIEGHSQPYYGTPKEAEGNSTVDPPEVLVAPTSISDRSAWRSMAPANPFARPFGY